MSNLLKTRPTSRRMVRSYSVTWDSVVTDRDAFLIILAVVLRTLGAGNHFPRHGQL